MRHRQKVPHPAGRTPPGSETGGFRRGAHRRVAGPGPAPSGATVNGATSQDGRTRVPGDFSNTAMANPLARGFRKPQGAMMSVASHRTGLEEAATPLSPANHPGAPVPAPAAPSRQRSVPAAHAPRPNDDGATHMQMQRTAGDAPAVAPSYRPAPSPAQQPGQNGQPWRPSQETVLGAWAGGQEGASAEDQSENEHVPKVLILDRTGGFSTNLARATVDLEPAPEILRLSRPTEVVEVVEQEEPEIIVVAPGEVTAAGLRRLAVVHRQDPRIVMVLSDNGKPLSPAQTAACGASDILPAEPTRARLKATIARAIQAAEDLRKEHLVITERLVVQEPDPPVPVPSYRPVSPASTRLARVFTVASASGGCGKTFYSTNFAAYLARATGGRVLLVDLDLQFGEVAISLHLRPKRTIAELIAENDIATALKDYTVEHRAGYHVLCAPRDPVAGDRVGPRETTAVLEAARTGYDYIVVDTPPTLNETCLAAFDQSQSLIIMATMDLPSLKNLRVFLETLKKLNLPADQVCLVVNKAESGTGIDLKEVEPLYPQGFSAVLPYAKQVSWSINMGVPVLVADPDAEISRKLVQGALKMVAPAAGSVLPWSTPSAAPRRGWFMRLLKGKAQ